MTPEHLLESVKYADARELWRMVFEKSSIGIWIYDPAPRSWAERSYPKLNHFHEVVKGGHFAEWEQTELFSTGIRAAFRWLLHAAASI